MNSAKESGDPVVQTDILDSTLGDTTEPEEPRKAREG